MIFRRKFIFIFLLIILLVGVIFVSGNTVKDVTKTKEDMKSFYSSSGENKQNVWEEDKNSNGKESDRNTLVTGLVKDIFQKQINEQKSSTTLAVLGQTAGLMLYNKLQSNGVTELGGVKINNLDDLSKLPDIAKKAGYDVSGVLRPQLESLSGFGSKDLKWSNKGKSIIGNSDTWINLEKLPFGVTKLNYDEKTRTFTLGFKDGGKLVLGKGATDENGNIKVLSNIPENSALRKLIMPFRDPKNPLGIEDFTLISGGNDGSVVLDSSGLKIIGDGTKIKYGEFVFGRKIGETGESLVVFENNNIKVKNTEVTRMRYVRVGAQNEEMIIGSGSPDSFKNKNFLLMNGENFYIGGKGKIEVLRNLQSVVGIDTENFIVKVGNVDLRFAINNGKIEIFSNRNQARENNQAIKINEVSTSYDGKADPVSFILDTSNKDGKVLNKRNSVNCGRMTKLLPLGISVDVHMELPTKDFERVKKDVDLEENLVRKIALSLVSVSPEVQNTMADSLLKGEFELKADVYTPSNAVKISTKKIEEVVNANLGIFEDFLRTPLDLEGEPKLDTDKKSQLTDKTRGILNNINGQVLSDASKSDNPYISSGNLGFSLKYNANGDPQVLVYSQGKAVSSSTFSRTSREGIFLNDMLELSVRAPNSKSTELGTWFSTYPVNWARWYEGKYVPYYGPEHVQRLYNGIFGRGNDYLSAKNGLIAASIKDKYTSKIKN